MTEFVDLPTDFAGVLLCEVDDMLLRMDDLELNERPANDPLPRGVLTCGQAVRFISVLSILLRQKFPQFDDPLVLEQVVGAFAAGASPTSLN